MSVYDLNYKDPYYSSEGKLSLRSNNILKKFGGLQLALEHYQIHGSFLNEHGCGLKSNVELCSLCYNILNKTTLKVEFEPTKNIIEDEIACYNSYMQKPEGVLIKAYELLRNELSVRANNILKSIEFNYSYDTDDNCKIEFIRHTIIKDYDFLKHKNLGIKTKLEIQELCFEIKSLCKNESWVFIQKVETIEPEIKMPEWSIIKTYERLKYQLSVRAINILKELESNNSFEIDDAHKIEFISTIFLKGYDFSKLRNLGVKTEIELKSISTSLKAFCTAESDYTFKEEIIATNSIAKKIDELFKNTLIDDEILQLVVEDELNIEKIIIAYLLYSNKGSRLSILHKYYFSDTENSIGEIAIALEYSIMNVKRLVNIFETEILEQVLEVISKLFSEAYLRWQKSFSNINICMLHELPAINFKGSLLKPNLQLNISLFTIAFKDLFTSFKSLIGEKKRKSFIEVDEIIFLSEHFITNTNFIALLNWLDEQIFAFECDEFEYNLRVLVQRFYQEHELEIDKALIKDVLILIEKIIKKVWSDIYDRIVQNRKRKKREEIFNLAEAHITANGKPQKTDSILAYLQENYVDIPKERLLQLLNDNKRIFKQVGLGYWALIHQLVAIEIVGGSIRDMVENLLDVSTIPLHVSELLQSIRLLRHINERSLTTNLKVDEHKKFHFFNCGFIGLANKDYDGYYHNIHRINPTHLLTVYRVAKEHPYKLEQELTYTVDRYGYPKIHLEYLLNNKDII